MLKTSTRASLALFALALAACSGGGIKGNESKPVADFKLVQSTVRPQVVTLDAAASFTTVGTLAKYYWTFGDEAAGAPRAEANAPTFQHAYAAPGAYTITLVVATERAIESEPFTQTVSVPSINSELPRARIVGPSSGNPGAALSFDGSTSTPASDLQLYAWSFGDGSTEQGADKKVVSHTFANPGNYKVTLTVTDSLQQNDTTELNVVVGAVGPVAVCAWSPTPALQGVPVQFNGSGSTAPAGSTISLYVWSFGDGSADGTGVTASHTYNVQATFKPKLKVLDSQSRLHEVACADVVVGAPPLCAGDYTLVANPNKAACFSTDDTTWGGNKLTIAMQAGGTITASEQFSGNTINYAGTWSGQTFTMTGQFDTQDSLGTTYTHNATVNGTWSGGCGGWSGTYVERISVQGLGTLCTLTWNITSTRL